MPGEDPLLTGQYAYSFITGMQGDGEYRLGGAGPKHFGVYDVPSPCHKSSTRTCTLSRSELTYIYHISESGAAELSLSTCEPEQVEACRHGHSVNGVDCGNATVSQKDLTEFYWPVWQQVAKANATSVMCSYVRCRRLTLCAEHPVCRVG